MTTRIDYPLTVFYDGACIVCCAEMEHYRRLRHEGRLRFVDISDTRFDPKAYGRSLEEFMGQMHVVDAAGRFSVGVDAFPAIWGALPGAGYRLMTRGLGLPVVRQAARLGYALFARMRRYLPRRQSDCTDGRCGLKGRHR